MKCNDVKNDGSRSAVSSHRVRPLAALRRRPGLRSSVFRLPSGSRGFTLMELLVVLAVIGVLMGLSFPALQRAIERARITRARTEVQTLQQAWLAYWNTYFDPADGTFDWPGVSEMDGNAVAILAGRDTDENPLGIAFMEFDERHFVEGYLDPWRRLYQVRLGSEDTDQVSWTFETRVFLGNGVRGRY